MRFISSVSIYISYSAGSNKNLIGMPIIPKCYLYEYRLYFVGAAFAVPKYCTY